MIYDSKNENSRTTPVGNEGECGDKYSSGRVHLFLRRAKGDEKYVLCGMLIFTRRATSEN